MKRCNAYKEQGVPVPIFCLVCDEIADISFSAAMEKLQQFFEKAIRKFNDCGLEFYAVIAALRDGLPADIASLLDFDRVLKTFC